MSALSVMVNDEMPIRRVQSAKRDTATRFGGKCLQSTSSELVPWLAEVPLDKFRKLRIVQWLKDHGQSHHESENEDRAEQAWADTPIRVLSCGEADRATAQPLFSQLNLIAQGRALAPKERRAKESVVGETYLESRSEVDLSGPIMDLCCFPCVYALDGFGKYEACRMALCSSNLRILMREYAHTLTVYTTTMGQERASCSRVLQAAEYILPSLLSSSDPRNIRPCEVNLPSTLHHNFRTSSAHRIAYLSTSTHETPPGSDYTTACTTATHAHDAGIDVETRCEMPNAKCGPDRSLIPWSMYAPFTIWTLRVHSYGDTEYTIVTIRYYGYLDGCYTIVNGCH
ncbi:uncharacterized protein CLUP02_08830 [Colletotrichum lupini]|uniref:Uncharacterized protein n=1 Tax=Colletotrichum lupini TaxID=145971 RepID=A0A9Q8SUK6_9PEZI|nr:uncharacterized protein CLUP02_08830 [Colletotrichum lupini]UQC83335.1 hypothetical protein CLUP02_08830 [Colletotrichum lupini]